MWHPYIADTAEWKGLNMPQMFDWIFYAIVVLPCVFLVWDWLRNR